MIDSLVNAKPGEISCESVLLPMRGIIVADGYFRDESGRMRPYSSIEGKKIEWDYAEYYIHIVMTD